MQFTIIMVIKMKKEIITLAHGSGGKEMLDLIKSLNINYRADWKTMIMILLV